VVELDKCNFKAVSQQSQGVFKDALPRFWYIQCSFQFLQWL